MVYVVVVVVVYYYPVTLRYIYISVASLHGVDVGREKMRHGLAFAST